MGLVPPYSKCWESRRRLTSRSFGNLYCCCTWILSCVGELSAELLDEVCGRNIRDIRGCAALHAGAVTMTSGGDPARETWSSCWRCNTCGADGPLAGTNQNSNFESERHLDPTWTTRGLTKPHHAQCAIEHPELTTKIITLYSFKSKSRCNLCPKSKISHNNIIIANYETNDHEHYYEHKKKIKTIIHPKTLSLRSGRPWQLRC